ncbi:hypothetical protein LOAG_03213 [Loa loa]|uniref:Uncharacterized protein n=1 Tax=Loa loa TaxID=7209 RepID=A0A1S0U5Q9_LOALO|nr:hypothetical protein LOAG_03213 [Loa loa]EFO25275.1 hypothetical protein LOAG_03213 [Loa loa]
MANEKFGALVIGISDLKLSKKDVVRMVTAFHADKNILLYHHQILTSNLSFILANYFMGLYFLMIRKAEINTTKYLKMSYPKEIIFPVINKSVVRRLLLRNNTKTDFAVKLKFFAIMSPITILLSPTHAHN